MTTYRITYGCDGAPLILRSDGATIPAHPGNADFRAFANWNAQQSVPLDCVSRQTPAPPPFGQLLDLQGLPAGLFSALALRLSASWASATPAEQQAAQTIIDSAGAAALARIQATGI